MGNACDSDDDDDGVMDTNDQCPEQGDAGYGLTNGCPNSAPEPTEDSDNDSVADAADNCVSKFNPDQVDRDGDGQGKACEDSIWTRYRWAYADYDDDDITNRNDYCPNTPKDVDVDKRGCPKYDD